MKTSTYIDKTCLVRALYSGYSLLSGYDALVLLTALVSMAGACNSWKQNCNLSVCTGSLRVLVYLLTYLCLWDTAARVSWDVLPSSIAGTVPCRATRTASAGLEAASSAKVEILLEKKFAPSRSDQHRICLQDNTGKPNPEPKYCCLENPSGFNRAMLQFTLSRNLGYNFQSCPTTTRPQISSKLEKLQQLIAPCLEEKLSLSKCSSPSPKLQKNFWKLVGKLLETTTALTLLILLRSF